MKRQSMSNGHLEEMQQSEPLNRASIEANIKSSMQLFVKCASLIVLDSWTENSRYLLQVHSWCCVLGFKPSSCISFTFDKMTIDNKHIGCLQIINLFVINIPNNQIG